MLGIQWPRWAFASAAVLTASLALFLVPLDNNVGNDNKEQHSRTLHAKGSWQLHVAVERRGETFRFHDGMKLETNDKLGLFYSAQYDGYLMVLYVDAVEEVVLFPGHGERSATVSAGQEVRLAAGALLSEGSGCEWVVGFFSPAPIGLEEAKAACREMLDPNVSCALTRARLPEVDTQVLRVER